MLVAIVFATSVWFLNMFLPLFLRLSLLCGLPVRGFQSEFRCLLRSLASASVKLRYSLSGIVDCSENHCRIRRGGRLLVWTFANNVVVVAFVAVWLCLNGTAVVSCLRQCFVAFAGGSVL